MAILRTPAPTEDAANSANFQRYYEEAGPDYAAWSPNFNMHFGYFRWGMNPLRREAMLEQMNCEVRERLRLPADSPVRVLDMGCGLGATLRSIARHLPQADPNGITLVPWQLEQGRMLNQSCPEGKRITLALGDYERTTEPSESFDAVYGVESSCYALGVDKSAFLQEARRLLRPGGRIVVADGFLSDGKLRGPQKAIYRRLCECWVIDTFAEVDQFSRELNRLGFVDVVVEPARWRVAPCVFHVPWVTLRFLLATVLFSRRKMTRARWNNVLAPILLPFVSYPVGPVEYYIVSATRG
jgi:cyclopropane fatty-acyl-phospholipid synthase-like methyltransferase